MADLTDAQAAQTVKITGANSSGVETNFATVDSDGSLQTKEVSSSTATLSSVASSVTSVTLLAANSARKGAIFHNDSSKNCFVAFAASASTTSFTIKMAAGSTMSLVEPHYTGQITGIWDSASGAMRVTELT